MIGTDGNVRTLAGGDRPGLADGTGAAARFDTPVALAFDAQGALLVADLFNNAVRRVGADGTVSTVVGGGGVINGPLSLATTHDVLAARAGDAAGAIRSRWSATVDCHAWPASGLAMDADGSVLVADATASHRLRPLPVGNCPHRRWSARPPMPRARTGGRWPLAPQQGWHEVVGTLGEVRGNFKGESPSPARGFDVRGDVGQTVLAIADGKISSPMAPGAWASRLRAWPWIASSTSHAGGPHPTQ